MFLRLVLIAAALGPHPAAWAQQNPTKVRARRRAFRPGGGTDFIARLMAQKLTEAFKGPQFIVENRPGAGATIGTKSA